MRKGLLLTYVLLLLFVPFLHGQDSIGVPVQDTLAFGVSDSVSVDSVVLSFSDSVISRVDTVYRPLTGRDSLQIMREMLEKEWDNMYMYGLQPTEGLVHKLDNPHLAEEMQLKKQVRLEKQDRRKLSPWKYQLSTLVQLSQNYISNNWYSGGNSNISLFGKVLGTINYDNKKGFKWQNSFEWRWGFNTVSGDSLRKIATNDDRLRLVSKVNYKAFSKWYYVGNMEFETYLFRTYKALNSTEMKTKFFSPLRMNLGLGLDYHPNDKWSIALLPVSYKLLHVRDTVNVDYRSFGVKEGKRSLHEFGSSVKIMGKVQLWRNIDLTTRFWFYTSYHDIETELELDANFRINRFLSARVSLYPRYSTQESSKIQFKELISIGFAHKFE